MEKVLFIAEPFYEYADKIKNTIEELKYDVDYLLIDNNDITNLSKHRNNKSYQSDFYKQKMNQYYDKIFVLVYSGIDVNSFNTFMNEHKNADRILYLWDDVKRVKDFESIKNSFDRIISFDRIDAEKYRFEFLPLFYIEDYVYNGEEKNIDISTCATLHSDRENIVNAILELIKDEGCEVRFILLYDFIRFIKDVIKRRRKPFIPSYMVFRPLSAVESANLVKHSKVILDIPTPSQKGLTMRTIESIAAKTKLITTNSDIKNYDFYNENNIYVIDRNNPTLDVSFLKKTYDNIDDIIIDNYSLNNWVKKILAIKDTHYVKDRY